MATYLYIDKHGTPFEEGDFCDDGTGNVLNMMRGLFNAEHYAKHGTVVKRADGTPVYRYKGGEDARVGDTLRRPSDTIGVVVADWFRGETESWAKCTLIRRAGESEPHPIKVPWSKTPIMCTGQLPGYEVLGHDRHGREVRRGDRVRCACGCDRPSFIAMRATSDISGAACFWASDGLELCTAFGEAELVTDEKAERCDHICGGEPCIGASGHVGNHESKAGFTWIDCESDAPEMFSGERAAGHVAILESLLRALAKPTMGERFLDFKARVWEMLYPYPALDVSFDCDAKNGPVCTVRHPLFAGMYEADYYCFDERSNDKAIQGAVALWAEHLGRAVLRKGRE